MSKGRASSSSPSGSASRRPRRSRGDGENDRELLDWAGYAVAVANAHEDILARADLVVPSVHEEGIALLLEAYLHSLS